MLRKAVLVVALLIGATAWASQSNTVESETVRVSFKSLNLNSAGSDNAVVLPAQFTKYIIRRVTVTNPSTSLGASIATLGVFTDAAGGGSTVVTAATLTTLTGATKFVDMTIALNADTLTASTLYLRNVLAHGGAATVDVYIDIQPLY